MSSGICFTVAEAKSRLGITGTSSDASLSSVADGVNSALIEFLGFSPDESDITEYLSTKGQSEICLRRWPVLSITSVHLDEGGQFGQAAGSFDDDTELTAGTDYSWAYTSGSRTVGVLRRVGGKWPWRMGVGPNRMAPMIEPCPGCVRVRYVIDPSRVLAAAKEAGLMEMAARWAMRATGYGLALQESMDGASISISPFQARKGADTAGDNFASPLVALMLRPYRITPLR